MASETKVIEIPQVSVLSDVCNPFNKKVTHRQVLYPNGTVGFCLEFNEHRTNDIHSLIPKKVPEVKDKKIMCYYLDKYSMKIAKGIYDDLKNYKKVVCFDCNSSIFDECKCDWSDRDLLNSARFTDTDGTLMVTKQPIRIMRTDDPSTNTCVYIMLTATIYQGMFIQKIITSKSISRFLSESTNCNTIGTISHWLRELCESSGCDSCMSRLECSCSNCWVCGYVSAHPVVFCPNV
jgi:hypothetical protein